MNLIGQKTIWWPTWQGWLLLLFVFAFILAILFLNVHRFLAVTEKVEGADILVVEAWVPKPVIEAAAREFAAGRYRLVLTTDERSSDDTRSSHRTTAATRILTSHGVPEDKILVCPVRSAISHRSYSLALSVGEELRRQGITPKGINTLSPSAHARKTLLAYRRALSSRFPVGIISVPTGDYDPARWWKSSVGGKWVILNGFGWLYELFAGPRG